MDIGSLRSQSQSQSGLEQREPRSPQQQQPGQQQTEQQQKPRLADDTILKWCSKAEELMQQASMGKQDVSEEAGPGPSQFGPLQRSLTALPAYSGTAMVLKYRNKGCYEYTTLGAMVYCTVLCQPSCGVATTS